MAVPGTCGRLGGELSLVGYQLISTLELRAELKVEPSDSLLPGSDSGQQFLTIACLLGAAVVLVLAAYLARGRLLRALARWWVVTDQLQPGEAVVVLTGDSPRTSCFRRAIQLTYTKWVSRVVLVDSDSAPESSLGSLMEEEASKLGVAPPALLPTRQADPFSVTGFLSLRDFLLQHNLYDVILVTPSLYARRAHVLSGTLWIPQGIRVCVCPVPDPDFRLAGWWETRVGRTAAFKEVAEVANTWWKLRRLRWEAFRLPARFDAGSR